MLQMDILVDWGKRAISIRDAQDPNDVLRVLSVSKSFFYMGIYAFYSLNNFTFSSFGELDRFLRGIGEVRRQRIQAINLCFIGAIMPRATEPYRTTPKPSDAFKIQFGNVRTRALHYLTRLPMLKQFLCFIDEGRIRRDYEERGVRKILERATFGHRNTRPKRSMRTNHGTDYLFQLRGMKKVKYYDYSAGTPRTPIHDQSFIRDLKAQIFRSKTPAAAEAARPHNLRRPLLPYNAHDSDDDDSDDDDNDDDGGRARWEPSRRVCEVIDWLLDPRYAAEAHNRNDGIPHHLSRGLGGGRDGSESSDDSDSDDSDNSNRPAGGSMATPVRYLRGRPNGCGPHFRGRAPFKIEIKQEKSSASQSSANTDAEPEVQNEEVEATQDMGEDNSASDEAIIKTETNSSDAEFEDEIAESDVDEAEKIVEDNSTERRDAMNVSVDTENNEDFQLEYDDHANALDDTEMSGIDQLNAYSGQLAPSVSPYSTSSRASHLDDDNDSDMLA